MSRYQIQSWQDFIREWEHNSEGKIFKRYEKTLYIVHMPHNWEWNNTIAKLAQTTVMSVSGGMTGAGTGHPLKLCNTSSLVDVLQETDDYDKVMIVSVGMVFDMAAYPDTAIANFQNSNTNFCKAHIIAHPGKTAFLHPQHIELNLKTWRAIGKPNIFGRWDNYRRSELNFHDDYTPYWIDVEDLPRIENFTHRERDVKAFAYPRKEENVEKQKQYWSLLRNSEFEKAKAIDERYMRMHSSRLHTPFYMENNEKLRIDKKYIQKYDLIVSPTAGYSTEYFCDLFEHEGEVLFYDYLKDSLDKKRRILDVIPQTYEQLRKAAGYDAQVWHVETENFTNEMPLYNAKQTMQMAAFVAFQERMVETNPYSFLLLDLCDIEQQLQLKRYIKDKRVFFNASNIFSYHVNHAVYTYEELWLAWKTLANLLAMNSKSYVLRGTNPQKERIYLENEGYLCTHRE